MLIFLICINIFAAGLFLQYFFAKDSEMDYCGFALSVFSGVAIGVAILVLLIGGYSSREKATQLNIDRANLQYYITHLDDYKERTVVEAINRYNVELKDFRAKQQSPWLNWFYPGDVSECEYIIWKN